MKFNEIKLFLTVFLVFSSVDYCFAVPQDQEVDVEKAVETILPSIQKLRFQLHRGGCSGNIKQILTHFVYKKIFPVIHSGNFIGYFPYYFNDNYLSQCSDVLPSRVWILPDRRVILDWMNLVVGIGRFKNIYFSVNLHDLFSGGKSAVYAGWDIKGIENKKNHVRELEIQREIFHAHSEIADPGEIIEVRENSNLEPFFHVIQPYYDGGSFVNFKVPLEQNLKKITHQLLSQMVAMHQLNIIHRDVKPENILTQWKGVEVSAHLADFGGALKLGDLNDVEINRQLHNLQNSTLRYLPPERLQLGVINRISALKTDVWALGMTLYFKLHPTLGRAGCMPAKNPAPPWELPTLKSLNILTSYENLCENCEIYCSSGVTGPIQIPRVNSLDYLIYRMLDPNPASRLSSLESLNYLKNLE